MKKFFSLLFNILWFIFVGVELGITFVFLGIVSCIFIIPIFIGIPQMFFKAAALVFAPAGKEVVLNFSSAPIRNILWLIFGGAFSFIDIYLYGIALCCTIIGIPLGIQLFKFGKFMLFPFGSEIIEK